MNARDLLAELQNGAVVRGRYKPRTIGKPKYVYELRYPDGRIQTIQHSTLAALPTGTYAVRRRQGRNAIYYCVESSAAAEIETMRSWEI